MGILSEKDLRKAEKKMRNWEMTQKDYTDMMLFSSSNGYPFIKQFKTEHRLCVKRAIRQGKNVPIRVLFDYPDLRRFVNKSSNSKSDKTLRIIKQSGIVTFKHIGTSLDKLVRIVKSNLSDYNGKSFYQELNRNTLRDKLICKGKSKEMVRNFFSTLGISKVSGFIGDEVLPELTYLKQLEKINIKNRDLVIAKLKSLGRIDVAKFIESMTPFGYSGLISRYMGVSAKRKPVLAEGEYVPGKNKPCPYCDGYTVIPDGSKCKHCDGTGVKS